MVKFPRLTVGLGEIVGFDGLCDGADLVDLQQETVARLFLDGHVDPLGVGHGQIVADDLDGRLGGQVGPALPVVLIEEEWFSTSSNSLCKSSYLVEGILDGDDGVLFDEAEVHLSELGRRDPFGLVGLFVLEVEVVFVALAEL